MITDEIYRLILRHFAKEWNVTPDKIVTPNGKMSVEVSKKGGETSYYLDFTIDWDGSYEEYWGEITHSELIEDLRDERLKQIGI